jgi:multidrug efflux system outer membrane protein
MATFRDQGRAQAESFADLPWWQVFRDDDLAALIHDALDHSYNIQGAVARVEQARQLAGISTDALLPGVTLQATPSYAKVFSPVPVPGRSGTPSYHSYTLQGSVSWEIDLWGRLRRLREAALAEYLASEEARRGVIVSLVATVAQQYFQLLVLDMQLDIARRTLASRQETLSLFQVQERGGVGTGLQTVSGQALVEDAAATIPSLEQQIATTENSLAALVGRPAGPIPRRGDLLRGPAPPEPPLGLPATLLERRPDLRQAEAGLVAANAQVGAALAQYFPTLTLLGGGGVQSISFSHLFTAGATIFSLSAVASWLAPLLNGAQIGHQVGAQRANWDALVAAYRQAVLDAFSDVDSGLATIRALRQQRAHLELEVQARIDAVNISRAQYQNGVASYLDVVQAEQQLFPTQLQLAQVVGAQFAAIAQLYRALGGGWQESVPTSAPGGPAAAGAAAPEATTAAARAGAR